MKKFGITFWFYAKEHFKKKSLIILAIFFAATVGAAFVFDHFGGGYSEIAIVENSSEFTIDPQMLEGLENRNFTFLTSEGEARQLLEDGEIEDAFIVSGEERPELTIVTNHSMADSTVEMVLIQLLTAMHTERIISDYDLPLSAVSQLSEPVAVNFETTAEVTDGAIASDIINFLFPYAILMVVMMSGQAVANSVSAEKNSRVMEVMLAKVNPTYSMVAKVLSAFLGVLLPIVAIGVGVAVAEMMGWIDLEMLGYIINEFFSVNALILLAVVFVLSYFCFIFLFTAAGAVSTSVESLTTTLAPLTYGLMVPAFLPSFLALDHPVSNILVYIPITSPFILVQRYLRGYSDMMEVGISIALMAVFAILTLVLSARIYMNGVSHTSEKINFSDLKKLLQK